MALVEFKLYNDVGGRIWLNPSMVESVSSEPPRLRPDGSAVYFARVFMQGDGEFVLQDPVEEVVAKLNGHRAPGRPRKDPGTKPVVRPETAAKLALAQAEADQGKTAGEIARALGVTRGAVYGWEKRGLLVIKKKCGARVYTDETLRQWVDLVQGGMTFRDAASKLGPLMQANRLMDAAVTRGIVSRGWAREMMARRVSGRERLLVEMRDGGATFASIAREFRVSRQRAEQMYRHGKRAMQLNAEAESPSSLVAECRALQEVVDCGPHPRLPESTEGVKP